jgi:endoglucanase
MFRILGLWLMLIARCEAAPTDAAWHHFKTRFISGDGRVLDVKQGAISHSEGQGYAMLLAEHFRDRPLFDRLWTWTRSNLQVRHDALLAWRWGQRENGEWLVADYNNATDGDLLVAYALYKASERWGEARYAVEARRIVQDIRRHLAVHLDDHVLILPAYTGFAGPAGFSFNPSYFIAAAYRKFATFDDAVFWRRAEEGGRYLLQRACSNHSFLPADWLGVGDRTPSTGEQRGRRFGYEAIRGFLYASWDGEPPPPCSAARLLTIHRERGIVPEWVSLDDDETATRESPAGFYAVLATVASASKLPEQSKTLRERAIAKLASEPDDYYSHALFLLSELAA